MKKQFLKKTVLLFAFIGLLSTQMNAQNETFDGTIDAFWTNINNWTNTTIATGEATIAVDVNLNGNQTVSQIKGQASPSVMVNF